MRTMSQWKIVWRDLEKYVKMHNRSVWIVPTENDYRLSIVEPEPHKLPNGTRANLYNTKLEIIKSLTSTN